MCVCVYVPVCSTCVRARECDCVHMHPRGMCVRGLCAGVHLCEWRVRVGVWALMGVWAHVSACASGAGGRCRGLPSLSAHPPVAPQRLNFLCGPSVRVCGPRLGIPPTIIRTSLWMAIMALGLLTSVCVSSSLWICVCTLHPGQPLQKGLVPEASGGL